MVKIFDKLKKFFLFQFQDRAGRDISLVASGVLAELIANGLTYLILTRIYPPGGFGVFASFVFFGTLLFVLSTLRYDWFIPSAKTDSEAINILFFCVLLIVFVSAFLVVPIFNLSIQIFKNSEIANLREYKWFSPFYVFSFSLYQVAIAWATRKKYFLDIAKAKFFQSISLFAISCGLAIFGFGIEALILGNIFSLFLGSLILTLSYIKKDREVLKDLSLRYAVFCAKKYFRLSIPSVGQSFISVFIFQAVPFLLTAYFNSAVAGNYFLADKIINLPTIIVGQATFQVFWSEASFTKNQKPKELMSLFMNFFRKLLRLSWIPVVIGILGPFTFEFIFGSKEWGRAGGIAFLLIPAVFSHFCIFPLFPIFIVLEKQHLLFLLDTLRMIFIFLCFYAPHKLNLEPGLAILFYSFATAFIYSLIFLVSIFEIKKKIKSFS